MTTVSPLSGLRAGVLEDEYLIAMLLVEILEGFGCHVLPHVATVASARALLERENPDFMLLDVNLGKETSAPIAELLEERGTPFLFVTGYGPESMHGKYAGYPTVGKPLTDADLEQALMRLLESKTRV